MKNEYIEFEVRTDCPGWPTTTERHYFDTRVQAVAFVKKMRPILSEGVPVWRHPRFTIERIVTNSNPFINY